MRTRPGSRSPFAPLLAALAALFVVGVADPAPVAAQESTDRKVLGDIEFPNSGAPEAQKAFERGVLLLHSFEYRDARRAFQEAREIDPDFALAYWGEAFTHNHPIWMEQDREAALEVLRELAPTPEKRLARAGTEYEKDWLRALHVLYGVGTEAEALGVGEGADGRPAPKEARDDAFREYLSAMHQKHPDDDEFATFYSLSILGTAHEGRDFRTYMQAAAEAQEVFWNNREHPGAAHYLIHSVDDPVHAPLGMPAARAYAEIAPGAAHAQHMTSHIFVALGKWDRVVEANERASRVQDERLEELGRPPNVCGHFTSWLEYGYLQQGRIDRASRVLEACHERVTSGGTDRERDYLVRMRARWILDTGRWSAVDRWSVPMEGADPALRAEEAWLRGFAALQRGETERARSVLDAMEQALKNAEGSGQDGLADLRIMADELRGLLAVRTGGTDEGIRILRSAAEGEAELPFAFGPPEIPEPTFELLGEALLSVDRPGEAVKAFERARERTPRRTDVLLGQARAYEALGRMERARGLYAELADIWDEADPGLDGLREVQRHASASDR